ncbi:hypothetical protein TRAPUB_2459 [Trametes pubescens]|uniref:Uncharacterized protein n=1 Tax=Trametes pubescens TaxID=154538 RepID=A0A1M2VGP6_TRAPU|nr:hypothetical protein TRAPUB_2459 [Trametes pubescens]
MSSRPDSPLFDDISSILDRRGDMRSDRLSFLSILERLGDPEAISDLACIAHNNVYAEQWSSLGRWHEWLDIIDDPDGLECLPDETTEGDRVTLRAVVCALIYFSVDHTDHRLEDGEPFHTCALRALRAEGLSIEAHLEPCVHQWIYREEFAYEEWHTMVEDAARVVRAAPEVSSEESDNDDDNEDNNEGSDTPSSLPDLV